MHTATSVLRPETSSRRRARVNTLDALLLLAVLVIGIFFRFYQQGSIPPGMDFDEAFESMQAHRLLTEPGYHPIFFPDNNGVPPVKIYLTAAAFLIGGEDRLSIRYVSAVTGVLTILALYVLARKLFPVPDPASSRDLSAGSPSAIVRQYLPFVACLLLAVLPWHTTFSRHGIEVILLPLWAILALLFLWQGFQSGRWWPFVLSGLAWGSAFYTYQAAWLLPGVLVVFLVYKLFQEPGFLRRYFWKLALLAIIALVVLLPLALFAYHNQGIFIHRTSQVGVFTGGQGSQTPLASLLNNALKVAGLFVVGGDIAITDNIALRPPLPVLEAAFLILGLLVALWRVKRPAYALLLIWFTWMLLPSILTENAPSIRRAIGSVPAMVMLIALGAGWVFDGLVNLAGRVEGGREGAKLRQAGPVAGGLLAGAFLLYTALWGYRYYFVEWPQGKDLFHFFDVGLVDLGKYAASTPADTRLYYTPSPEGNVVHLPLSWQIRDRALNTFDGHAGLVLAPPGPAGSVYLITTFLGDGSSLPALQALYPAGRVAFQVSNLYGVPHSLAFAVSPGTSPMLALQNRLQANFDNQIELLGSDLSAVQIRPGGTLTVTLAWQATVGPTELSDTVFTHLLGPTNPASGNTVWAGQDGTPVGGSYRTVHWVQGEIILDRHVFTVPDGAPPAVYQVEVGLYTPERGGARLPVLDAAGKTLGDSVPAGQVTVQVTPDGK
jgi:4-amino-4-deoxy-L-arabinose transferase-like glycosyltransferase